MCLGVLIGSRGLLFELEYIFYKLKLATQKKRNNICLTDIRNYHYNMYSHNKSNLHVLKIDIKNELTHSSAQNKMYNNRYYWSTEKKIYKCVPYHKCFKNVFRFVKFSKEMSCHKDNWTK